MTHEHLIQDGYIYGSEAISFGSGILEEIERAPISDSLPEINETTDRLVAQRLATLAESSKPQNYFMTSGVITEFIHPESIVENYANPLQSFFFDGGLRLDDDVPYKILIESMFKFRKNPNFEGEQMSILVPFTVIDVHNQYFANEGQRDEVYRKNADFSQSGVRSIKEYAGKGMAVCAQMAPLTHNILKFLDYDATLVYSLHNRFEGEEVPHVFNMYRSDHGVVLYDSSQPAAVIGEAGNLLGEFPALYPLSDAQALKLKSGGKVEVSHSDVLRTVEGELIAKEPQDVRVYSGE